MCLFVIFTDTLVQLTDFIGNDTHSLVGAHSGCNRGQARLSRVFYHQSGPFLAISAYFGTIRKKVPLHLLKLIS